jgi:peptidoglycan hydrolase-like protein with peptidoglycan-binding domain
VAAEPGRPRPARAVVLAGGVFVVVLIGGAWAARDAFTGHTGADAESPVRTSTAAVTRTDVAQRQQVVGTLGYQGAYTVVAAGDGGVLTRLPATGATVSRGRPAYEVGGEPVPLFYGARPLWRELRLGVTAGADVRELETNLAALGYGAGVTVDRRFTSATYWAVRRWQDDAGLPVTGAVPLGQVAVLPGPLRVTGQNARAGTPVRPGMTILHGTGTGAVVQVAVDPTVAPSVHRHDAVLVTLPDGHDEPGRVTHVSRVAVAQPNGGDQGAPQQSLIPVTVRLRHHVADLDQAQVQVAITSEEHRNVLAVPITALLARPGGGHQVVLTTSRRTVPVQVGLFDDSTGVVEVRGAGLAEGVRVEVPAR